MSDYRFLVDIEDTDLRPEDAKEINNAVSDAVWRALAEQDIETDGVSVNVSAPEIDGQKSGQFSVMADPHSEEDDDE